MVRFRSLLVACFFLLPLLGSLRVQAQSSAPGYDVILLAGQSNMVGFGTGPDTAADAAVSPRVFMWNYNTNAIVPAQDPLIMNQSAANIGPGLTFAKAYAASIAANRNVLLVGAARGTTGFNNGWLAPNTTGGDSSLALDAVILANNAMAAAGSGARFIGILWDQGENDILASSGAAAPTYADQYQTNLVNLVRYFRAGITGATSATPFVVTEMNYYWLTSNYSAPSNGTVYNSTWVAPSIQIQRALHTLPDVLNNTAWTDTAVLAGDGTNGLIHYCALSQRQIGRRDADRLFEAQLGLPQTQTQLVASSGYFIDEGRSYLDAYPYNYYPATTGTVTATADAARGTIAQIAQAQGFLTVNVAANTFNGSYTKMAWFKPGSTGYYNNLVSGNTNGQAHYLLALTSSSTQLAIYGGHSNGSSLPNTVNAVVAAPAGQWENIALVYDAAAKTMTLYYNGVVVSSATNVAAAPQVTATGTLPLEFGSYGPGTNGSANGGVDGAMGGNRVWTSALTAAQVSAIYQHELLYRAGF